ncbi:restriction endonuclease subunit S [Phototrophicus methaneseepsis]|uniref:Restriction endonuclease subunit S n=1 Tax=Phototrophicus methaneseepsis TaxID=2710758 RepID=A0A7S8IFL2_9CHLR|nr:restriction endonuclease subunit S [Phototrophicus methaneseepsis]QPC83068.1 restriction endonuclease subunit S [Phototrophicus methaneseepsis]
MSQQSTLPSGWDVHRFDEIAESINERILPEDADGLLYVGLEHLEPESLKIRQWGTPDDVDAQKLRFYPGDIIFGKRRFYQRKLAVAEFDGICSAHAMVLRAKSDVVLPEFFPFFMQSEEFFRRAMSISVGSLSPTINWRTLARQKFALPPMDEQQRIAEILWSVEKTYRSYDVSLSDAIRAKDSLLTRLTLQGQDVHDFQHSKIGDIPKHWRLATIGDVLESSQYGLSVRADDEGKYPIFRMMNIEDGVIVENDMKYVDLTPSEFDSYSLMPGDILFNRTNSIDLVGKVGIYRLEGNHVFASYLIRLRADRDHIIPEYMNYYLNSKLGQHQIRRYITAGVSQANVNATNLQRVLIPLPPIEEQNIAVNTLAEFDDNILHIREHLEELQALKRYLISSILENYQIEALHV